MGGTPYLDRCRALLNVVSLIAFGVFSFYLATKYRANKGLLDCQVVADSEQPLKEEVGEDARNVSEIWRIMFMICLGKVALAFIHIVSASCAEKDTCFYNMIWCFAIFYYLLNVAIFIWFHIERWGHSGRVCSGDFLSEEDY